MGIYFDNAATTYPKPRAVGAAMQEALRRYGANPGRAGHRMSLETAAAVYRVREEVSALFGMPDPERVIFTLNCTHSLDLILHGLIRPGDHVVISDLEHNSVWRPVWYLAQAGAEYTIAKVYECDDDRTVESFRQAIRPNTKLVICTHGSNTFGIKLPIKRIAQVAHAAGALFAVDAAQTAGTVPIDVQKMGIDLLAAPGHKGLYGPTGTGILLVAGDVSLRPLMQGGTGSLSLEPTMPDLYPDRLESGTVNTVGILGLGAGIRFVRTRTVEAIRQHELALAQRLYDILSSRQDIRLFTRRPDVRYHLPVISFAQQGVASEETAARLDTFGVATRAGFHCAPLAHKKFGTDDTGTVRLSLGAFNTAQQVEAFSAIVKKL